MPTITPSLWFDDDLEEAAVLNVDLPELLDRGVRALHRRRAGLSWQVIPDRLNELVNDADPARAAAATKAMLGMRKIVIAELEEAVGNV